MAMTRPIVLVSLVLTLSACATVDPERDTAQINQLLAERGAPALGWERSDAATDEARVQAWLAEPLTVDTAVQTAMIRSPRLQRQYGELGLARADILEAVQIANPRLSYSRLDLKGGSGAQTTYGLAMPLVDLIVLPARVRLARSEYERARYQIASAILTVSLDVEAAWYRAVGGQQVAEMRAAVAEALDVSAELAQRFFDAGNITELQLSREQAAGSQARIEAARATVDARLARLELNTLIGLSGAEAGWRMTTVLPLPVATEDDPVELRRLATTTNLDLLAARREAAITADAARLARTFRLLGGTAIGYEREKEVDGAKIRGPTLDLELPIFNQGQARVARAQARLAVARARLAEIELTAGGAVDLGAERVRVLSDVVRIYREALVPQRETVVLRSQEEQNFMLIGQFEVLQAKTQEYDAYQGYLEAVRDYWVARVDLMRVVGSRLPSEAQVSETTPSLDDILTPPPAPGMEGMSGMNHSAHGGTPAPQGGDPASPASRAADPPATPADPHAGHATPSATPTPQTPPAPPQSSPTPDRSGDPS